MNGVSYNNLNNDFTHKMSLDRIKLNIDKKYPIQATFWEGGDMYKGWHDVTVYGYRVVSLNDYISVWNSGAETNMSLLYKAGGTVLPYNNKCYIWSHSLSMY